MASPELEIEKIRKLMSSSDIGMGPNHVKVLDEIIEVFRRNAMAPSEILTMLTILISSTIKTLTASKEQRLNGVSIVTDYLVSQSSSSGKE